MEDEYEDVPLQTVINTHAYLQQMVEMGKTNLTEARDHIEKVLSDMVLGISAD